jgi:hypothetical protein
MFLSMLRLEQNWEGALHQMHSRLFLTRHFLPKSWQFRNIGMWSVRVHGGVVMELLEWDVFGWYGNSGLVGDLKVQILLVNLSC